jgi:hypothetical protein
VWYGDAGLLFGSKQPNCPARMDDGPALGVNPLVGRYKETARRVPPSPLSDSTNERVLESFRLVTTRRERG